jgi:two-component system response regulator RegA
MMTDKQAKTILIVDDDEILRTRMCRAFEHRGLYAYTADSAEAAMQVIAEHEIDLAVIDLKMPGKSGMELLVELKEKSPQTQAVVLTGYGSIANAVEAVKLGAANYVTKPADIEQILAAFSTDDSIDDAPYQSPSLASAEWNHIQRVLTDCGGNISEAARCLDIPRRTLQRKLKKLAP